MTNVVKIRKGLDLRLIGEVPDGIPGTLPAAGRYAVFPDDYYGIVPKLAKKEGEVVRAGEMVLYDKNNENVAIVSMRMSLSFLPWLVRWRRWCVASAEKSCG